MEVDEEYSSSSESNEVGATAKTEPNFQLCVGFREDCTRLAALVRDQLTVQALFDAWKETRFHRVYMGRRYFTELLEFTEEALVIARDLWLDDAKDIREQASYFLVLAGLYLRQPFCQPSRPSRIRLTSKHVDLVSNFIDRCDAENLHDCIRLLDALFSEGALDLVTYPREFGLERNTLAYLRRDALHQTLPTMKGPNLRYLPEVSELRKSLAQYCAAKRGLDNAPKFVTSGRLDSFVPKVESESDDGDEEWRPDMEDARILDSIASRRQKLKNRAFATAAVRKESVVESEMKKEQGVEPEEPASTSQKASRRRKAAKKIKEFY